MKNIIGVLLFVHLVLSSAAVVHNENVFDEQAAWSYIKDLAADDMLGRESGEAGGVLCEEYIAARFKQWGIEPAGDEGSYFQTFHIEHRKIGQGVKLEIIAGTQRREFYYGEDWRVMRYSGSGHFSAEVVFVGYGIHAPDKGYDDYAGVDVERKLVMFASGAPPGIRGKLGRDSSLDSRVRAARELGAYGIMGFPRGNDPGRFFRYQVDKEDYDPDFVLVSVQNRVSDFIFKELATELRFRFQEIDRTQKPQSFATGIMARVDVDAVYDPARVTRNVLGKLTGSDDELRKEYVIIGAHMDHLGVSPLGEVYNGANDNASGTAVVMEIARIMNLSPIKPKRTVIFGLWAAEEQGLQGSKHYCQHPIHPLETTVAYINLEMVGHGDGMVNFGGEYYSPEIWNAVMEDLSEPITAYTIPHRGGPGSSDHNSFLSLGVPALSINSEGYHFKYHSPRDDFDLIKPEQLRRVGDLVYASATIIASESSDLIQPQRQARYQFRYQDLVDLRMRGIDEILSQYGDTRNSHVDIQLAVLAENPELQGNALRVNLIDHLMTTERRLNQAENWELFSSAEAIFRAARSGRTTLVPGLASTMAFRDAPEWAAVLAGKGARFVVVDEAEIFFEGAGLSVPGTRMLEAIRSSGLLFILRSQSSDRILPILKAYRRRMVILSNRMPDAAVLSQFRKHNAVLGYILDADADLERYFQDLDRARKSIGTSHLWVVSGDSLWEDSGSDAMLSLFSRIISADYESADIRNLISETFLRMLPRESNR